MNKSNTNLPATPQNQPQKPKFSVAITSKGYQTLVNNTLGDPARAKRFIASVTSAVAVNPSLQDCEAGSILAVGLLGESLNLSPSPQLGQYFFVPFNCKAKYEKGTNTLLEPECKKAQFVIGYKGYIQLALNSGLYRKINVLPIKEGEFKSFDPLNEELKCIIIEDPDKREAAPTIGYYVMFELLNGFRKVLYWTKNKMIRHADKYSPAFSAKVYADIQAGKIADKDMWRYSSFWYKDFDDMGMKTMLRQILGHWGQLSPEMQAAFEKDGSMAMVNDNNQIVNIPEADLNLNAEPEPIEPEFTEVIEQVDLDTV